MASILRYPYDALTDKTDYLQIDIRQYQSVQEKSGSLVSGDSQRNFNAETGLEKTTATERPLKTNGTIFLPIPSNVQDGNSVDFAAGNLDGLTAEVYSSVRAGIEGFDGVDLSKPFGPNGPASKVSELMGTLAAPLTNNAETFKKIFLAQIAAQAANIPLGGSLTRDAVFARQSGDILNQNVELLFNGVNLRSFKFSFKLTPRGPEEAKQVKLIINAFKRNMAPKLGSSDGGDSSNIFLSTPNVFNLTYKKGTDKHPFLHTFKQCALTDMSVNYTGEGVYATYGGSSKGGEGTPVSMILELGFKELEPIYDTDYNGDDDLTEGVGY